MEGPHDVDFARHGPVVRAGLLLWHKSRAGDVRGTATEAGALRAAAERPCLFVCGLQERHRLHPLDRAVTERFLCLRLPSETSRMACDEAIEMQNRLCKPLLPTGASKVQWLTLTKAQSVVRPALEQLAAYRARPWMVAGLWSI